MKNRKEHVEPIPEVGMVATLQLLNDRVVRVITYVSDSGKTIRAARAHKAGPKLWKASTDKSDENTFRKNKQGRWEQIGHPSYRPILTVGIADPYYCREI